MNHMLRRSLGKSRLPQLSDRFQVAGYSEVNGTWTNCRLTRHLVPLGDSFEKPMGVRTHPAGLKLRAPKRYTNARCGPSNLSSRVPGRHDRGPKGKSHDR